MESAETKITQLERKSTHLKTVVLVFAIAMVRAIVNFLDVITVTI